MALTKDLVVQGASRFISDAYFAIIKAGTWNGSTITVPYGGTGATSFTSGAALIGNGENAITTKSVTTANTANAIVARDASGNFSAGTITATLSGAATYASNVGAAGSENTNYVTATNVISMYNWYNTITATDEASNTAIDKWNEIISFLAGVTDDKTLSGLLAGKANSTHNHSASDIDSGTLGVARGGTGLGTIAIYSVLYASAANTLSALSPNTSDTRKFLRMVGDGTNGAAPAWDTVTKTDVGLSNVENTKLSTWTGSANITTLGTVTTGTWSATTIAVNKGGTGKTSWTKNGIIYASDTTTLSQITVPSTASKTYWLKCVTNASGTPTYSFDELGSAISHNHGDYVTDIGVSGDTLTWSKGGTAQTAITVPFATTAAKLYDVDYHDYSHRRDSSNLTYADGALHYYLATSSMTSGKPADDAHILHMSWDNGAWDGQLAIPTSTTGSVQWRTQGSVSNWAERAWTTILDANNYTSYTVTKTGSGASGTWGIDISGSAASADSVAWGNISSRPDFTTWTETSSTASYNLSNADWTNAIDLPTTAGSYILQMVSGNSTLTGVFSIGTQDNAKDEINLHLHGNGVRLYARTNGAKLQLSSNYTPTQSAATQSTSVTIKYRRMI